MSVFAPRLGIDPQRVSRWARRLDDRPREAFRFVPVRVADDHPDGRANLLDPACSDNSVGSAAAGARDSRWAKANHHIDGRQSGIGPSILSITTCSTGAVVTSSLSPSCSRTAEKIDGDELDRSEAPLIELMGRKDRTSYSSSISNDPLSPVLSITAIPDWSERTCPRVERLTPRALR